MDQENTVSKIPEFDRTISHLLSQLFLRPSTRRGKIAVSISAPSPSAKIIAGGFEE